MLHVQQLDCTVKVWRRLGEWYANCGPNGNTGGGSVMVWGCISLTGKKKLVIIAGNFNPVRY